MKFSGLRPLLALSGHYVHHAVSAFGGKADITRRCLHVRFDPKRTLQPIWQSLETTNFSLIYQSTSRALMW